MATKENDRQADGGAGSSAEMETVEGGISPGTALLSERPGSIIGRYKLLQQIGEGGFGVVYLAEQEQPVRRRVALKIIKLGMDTRQVIARFEAERQALAIMDHPHIAKVLDAGATATGRPYFVMELVKGMPITEYCDKESVSLRDRLNLFISVCGAVQHAHQKGLIHRDLKPSNILVTLHDGQPVPKVIDFGIAKATEQRLTKRTMFTEYGQFIGTPEYMSPEQAEMSSLDIDTRSDIYSLGVVLYELLTGFTPFDLRTLRGAAIDEIRRIIREREPSKPSTRISTVRDELPNAAKRRGLEGRKLGTVLRGDLDWIVMKALAKDRQRRYETANGLGMDLQRYLRGEAVVAAPPSASYRMQKFVRRHKSPVAAGALMVLAILVGSGLAVSGFVQARRQRDMAVAAEQRAVAEAESARQITDFLATMLQGVGPEVALGRDTTLLREIVDGTAERVEVELASQPIVASRLLRIISSIYNQLAVYDESEQAARRSVELLRAMPGDHRAAIARALVDVANTLESMGRYEEAKAAFRESYDLYCATGLADTADALTALSGIGAVLYHLKDFQEAERVFRRALDGQRALAGGRDTEKLATGIDRLALVLSKSQEDIAEAVALSREALAMRRRLFGDVHPDVTLSLSNLATLLANQRGFDEAIELAGESLEQHRQLFGERHPRTASAMDALAWIYQLAGRPGDAVPLARSALEINTEKLGADHRTTINSIFSLGTFLDAAQDYAGAEEQYRSLLDLARTMYAAGDNRTSAVIMLVANAVMNQGRASEAEPLYREALEGRLANRPPGHRQTTESRFALADCLTAQQRWAEAEPLLLAEAQPVEADAAAGTQSDVLNRLTGFYSAWGQAEPNKGHDAKAAAWRAKLEAAKSPREVTSKADN